MLTRFNSVISDIMTPEEWVQFEQHKKHYSESARTFVNSTWDDAKATVQQKKVAATKYVKESRAWDKSAKAAEFASKKYTEAKETRAAAQGIELFTRYNNFLNFVPFVFMTAQLLYRGAKAAGIVAFQPVNGDGSRISGVTAWIQSQRPHFHKPSVSLSDMKSGIYHHATTIEPYAYATKYALSAYLAFGKLTPRTQAYLWVAMVGVHFHAPVQRLLDATARGGWNMLVYAYSKAGWVARKLKDGGIHVGAFMWENSSGMYNGTRNFLFNYVIWGLLFNKQVNDARNAAVDEQQDAIHDKGISDAVLYVLQKVRGMTGAGGLEQNIDDALNKLYKSALEQGDQHARSVIYSMLEDIIGILETSEKGKEKKRDEDGEVVVTREMFEELLARLVQKVEEINKRDSKSRGREEAAARRYKEAGAEAGALAEAKKLVTQHKEELARLNEELARAKLQVTSAKESKEMWYKLALETEGAMEKMKATSKINQEDVKREVEQVKTFLAEAEAKLKEALEAQKAAEERVETTTQLAIQEEKRFKKQIEGLEGKIKEAEAKAKQEAEGALEANKNLEGVNQQLEEVTLKARESEERAERWAIEDQKAKERVKESQGKVEALQREIEELKKAQEEKAKTDKEAAEKLKEFEDKLQKAEEEREAAMKKKEEEFKKQQEENAKLRTKVEENEKKVEIVDQIISAMKDGGVDTSKHKKHDTIKVLLTSAGLTL